MSHRFNWYNYLLLLISGAMLLSGCLPEGCLGKLRELPQARPRVETFLMNDEGGGGGGDVGRLAKKNQPAPPVTARTPVCTEFAAIRKLDNEILIFVDKNASLQHDKGENWHSALRSVGSALKRAFDIHQDAIGKGAALKKIYIIVAGGIYDLAHEKSARQNMLGHSAIISINENNPLLHEKIELKGGYRSGDHCLEYDKNVQVDPQGDVGRETVLDGKDGADYSNHVVDITDAKEITLDRFTIQNGQAKDNLHPSYGQMGGAVLIRGNSHHMGLKNLTLKNSQADHNGGCLALIDDVHTVLATNISATGCEAAQGGGGVFIGGSAGVLAAADNIKFTDAKINQNTYNGMGGGVLITSQAANILFENGTIDGNKVKAPAVGDEKGGGVAITGLLVGTVKFTGGRIQDNEAKLHGGGVYIFDTTPLLPAVVKFTFQNMYIDINKITSNDPNARGAGFYGERTGNILLDRGGISGNRLNSGNGAGMALFGAVSDVTVQGVMIDGNHKNGAAANGIGVWMKDAGPLARPTRISFTQQTQSSTHSNGLLGAGMYAENVDALVLSNVFFGLNLANQDGGGLYAKGTYIQTHQNVRYALNRVLNRGGALFVKNAKNAGLVNAAAMPMQGIFCQNNSAGLRGGCAYINKAPGTQIVGGSYVGNGRAFNNGLGFVVNKTQDGGALYYVSDSAVGGVDGAARLAVSGGAQFSHNEALNQGGALFTQAVFDVQFDNVVLGHNSADHGAALFGDFTGYVGAANNAHHNGATVIVQNNSAFNQNHAVNGPGGAFSHNVCIKEFKTMGVVNFNLNTATLNGGAVNLLHCNNNQTAVNLSSQTIFDTNKAGYNANGANVNLGSQGGAMFIGSAPRTVRIAATFSANHAQNGGGALALAGGGLDVSSFRLNVTGPALGGPAYARFRDNITHNGNGGAVLVAVGIRNYNHSHLKGAYATNKAPAGVGGALAFMGNIAPAALPLVPPPLRIEQATFDANVATKNPAIHFANVPAQGLEFNNTTLKNNQSTTAGDGGLMDLSGINIANLRFTGVGQISMNANVPQVAQRGGAFAVGQITNNLQIDGQTVSGYQAQQDGGFISVNNAGANLDVAIVGSTFRGNRAQGNPGGGVLSITSLVHDITLRDALFENNFSQGVGGAIAIAMANNIMVVNTGFSNNSAQGHGGALFITQAANVTMRQTNNNALKAAIDKFVARYLGLRSGHLAHDELLTKSHNNTAGNSGGLFYFATITGNVTFDDQLWFNNTAQGHGGALFVNQVNGDISITNPLLYKNTSNQNGGAVAVNNAANVRVEAYLDVDAHPFNLGAIGLYTIKDQRDRFDNTYFAGIMAQIYADEMVVDDASTLANNHGGFWRAGNINNYRGQFLVEENTSQTGNGGAFYIGNATNINITRMPFRDNKALQGTGGTIYASNVRGAARIDSCIIYGGQSSFNAGGMWFSGIGVNPDNKLVIDKSSMQNCRAGGGANINGAAGIYADNLASVQIDRSNFFDNHATALPGTRWASALRFETRAPVNLPAKTVPYQAYLLGGGAAAAYPMHLSRLVDMARIPAYFYGPIEVKDNTVIGDLTNSVSAFSIPQNLRNDAAYYQFGTAVPPNVFDVANNQPPTVDNQPLNVVFGH